MAPSVVSHTEWNVFAAVDTCPGPSVGNWVAQLAPGQSFRWPVWVLLFFSSVGLLVCFIALPETSPTTILHWRAKRLRARTGDPNYHTLAERAVSESSVSAWSRRIFVKPLTLNFQEPIVLVLNCYLALGYSLLFAQLETYRFVFSGIYGFSSGQEGLTFLACYVGFVIAQIFYFLWYWKYQEPEFDAEGKIAPERRLLPAFCAAFTIPIGLFWFGWSSEARVHVAMPIIGGEELCFGP